MGIPRAQAARHSGDKSLRAVGWSYEKPLPEFAMLAGSLSFYPALLECTVDGERVKATGWLFAAVGSRMKLLVQSKADHIQDTGSLRAHCHVC
jgi:hypothetical protein